jgi:putative exosortase-associated protein (TIGR04073 family)
MTHFSVISVRTILLTALIIGSLTTAGRARATTYQASQLERSLVKIFFYPYNRVMDFNDIVHFGIAGSLGFGAELAVTENASIGAMYIAREKGIAYHGHDGHDWEFGPNLFGSPFYGGEHLAMWRGEHHIFGSNGPNTPDSPWSWFGMDAPNTLIMQPILGKGNISIPATNSSNLYLLPSAIVKLIPGTGNKQRIHQVKHGYATASFGSLRVESSDDDSLHFRRYTSTSRANELLSEQFDQSKSDVSMLSLIGEHLDGSKAGAIRGEAVLGLIHPYIAFEFYEALDFLGGTVMLDLKKDDWNPEPGRDKGRKLGRGVNNIVFGMLEIPRNIQSVNEEKGGSAALTEGIFRGFYRAAVRAIFVGPYEVLTFPTNTDPIVEPEFYFEPGLAETEWRMH